MKSVLQDQTFVHTAHTVSLTTMWNAEGPVGPSIAAQCTGRVGWHYKNETHPFMEMYRGNNETEAQRRCDEHNAEFHAVVGSTPEGQKDA